jgi:hypothetical protein
MRMLRIALPIFMIGGGAAWGQAQDDASNGAVTVDKAAAYYHYTVARMYAELAAASEAHRIEYVNKAIENYKAASKADPQMPMLSADLARIYLREPLRPAPRLLATPPVRTAPKKAP